MEPHNDLENTKEIQNFEELRMEEENENIEEELESQMDAFAMESEEEFQNRIETLETEEQKETEPKKKKSMKEKIAALKEKWNKLKKPQKIGIIIGSLLVFLCIIGLIVFLIVHKKETKEETKVPDVIVQEDNYRYENGTLIFLNKAKEEIGRYECENKDQKNCYVAYYTEEDQFDEPKFVYEDGKEVEKRSKIYLEQYAFIYDSEKEKDSILLYDFQSNEKIGTYEVVKAYDKLENQVVLKNNAGEYGLYRLTEEGISLVGNNVYDYLGVIENEKEDTFYLVTKKTNRWYLTDLEGKDVSSAITHEIKDYNDHVITTKDAEGYYHLTDYNNKEIHSGYYDFIDLIDNYALFIEDMKMMVYDTEGHKMHTEPIELKNTDYVQTSVYTDNNRLKETKQSYEITYQGNLMNVRITGGGAKSINVNEGRVSATLKYMDYFDGKIYIYEDEAKEKQLGVYTCNNKNSIDEETSELQNCKIATESSYSDNDIEMNHQDDLGTLPIYNKRYAFIKDGNAIILYDLTEGRNKTTSNSIDASAYTKTNEITWVSTNSLQIIAENTGGKFGIIEMTSNDVKGLVEFNYSHIERIGLNYLVQDSSGYKLLNQKGEEITDSCTNKIKNYNGEYFLTFNDNKYYLYPYKGTPFDKTAYDYIALYEDYYGVIQSNNLSLYAYEDVKKDEKYDYLKDQNLVVTDKNNFDIEIKNQTAIVTINGKTTEVKLKKESKEPEEEEIKPTEGGVSE